MLELRVKYIEDAVTQNLNKTRLARSQGKKIQITMGQEYSRLLGNLAWAYLQQDKYKLAEEIYRYIFELFFVFQFPRIYFFCILLSIKFEC